MENYPLSQTGFHLALNDLTELSREVGYYNHKANKEPNAENIAKYEELRLKELRMIKQVRTQFQSVIPI